MRSRQVLYTSADVRKTIIEIFQTSRGRRVAITAFVGSGAESYLPKSEGIELVCWPKAGGTNPNAIRTLIKRGVQVYFADALHMKIYWSEDKGAVITSANLSTNALGSGNLREIGVFLPSGQVEIDEILRTVSRRPVSNKELLDLDKRHHDYEIKNRASRDKSNDLSFSEWYQLPFRSAWKIGYWDADSAFASTTKKIAKEEYGVTNPHDFISCAGNTYKKNDWVLTFYLKRKPRDIRWLPIDYVAPTPKSEKSYERECPYQAVQVWPISRYPAPPFRVDKRLRTALVAAIQEIGVDKFKEDDPFKPSKRLIELIHEYF